MGTGEGEGGVVEGTKFKFMLTFSSKRRSDIEFYAWILRNYGVFTENTFYWHFCPLSRARWGRASVPTYGP